MKFRIISLIFFLLILVGTVSAAEEELFYQPNTSMNIVIKCFDIDSNLCSSSTECRLDVFYPNMTSFIYNVTMQRNGTFYNYTVSATSILGVYHASTTCADGTTAGYSTFDFYVGNPSTDPQIKLTILAISILLGVAVLFFIGFLFTKKDIFKWSFFLLAILFLVITVNVASISLRNEAGSENIRNIFDKIGAVSYYMYWMCFGLLFFLWAFGVIVTIGDKWKMRRAREIGQPMDLNKY